MFGEIETLRFGYETELLQTITRRFGPIPLLDRTQGQHLLDSRRRDLLGDAVRVTEALLPEVYGVYRECLESIGGGWVGDLFVCQNPVYNAGVFAQGETFDLLIHSGLLNEFSPEELREAVQAAHEQGKRVMFHANGVEPVRGAVEAGCDSIEHGFFMGEENLARMAERGTIWVPTAVTMRAYAETLPADDPAAEIARRTFDHQLRQIEKARELGVQIAVGTDAGSLGVEHGRAVAWEMGILVEAGFSISEAVRFATENGAQLLGYPELGRIVPGRPGRLLAVEGGPESLLANLGGKRFVRDNAAPVR